MIVNSDRDTLVWISNVKNIPEGRHPQQKRITAWLTHHCKKRQFSGVKMFIYLFINIKKYNFFQPAIAIAEAINIEPLTFPYKIKYVLDEWNLKEEV